MGDSLEFSVVRNLTTTKTSASVGLTALRVVKLPRDTVKFEHISDELYTGLVEREPPFGAGDDKFGCIRYEYPPTGTSNTPTTTNEPLRILFNYKNQQQCENDVETTGVNGATNGNGNGTNGTTSNSKQMFYNGDKVQFNVLTCIRTNTQYAVNVRLVEARKEVGYITMLKDNYGFIELDILFDSPQPPTSNKMPKDIFFHYSSVVQGPASSLEIGDLVEFSINRKAKQKLSAENVVKLVGRAAKKFKKSASGGGKPLRGKVVQTLRSHTTNANGQEQTDETYYGKIQVLSSTTTNNNNNNEQDSVKTNPGMN